MMRLSLLLVIAASAYALPAFPVRTNGPICNLQWFYCPNDPGCSDYQLSIKSVEVDVDSGTFGANTNVKMIVTGKTNLTAVPPHASYKVYSMPGKNIAQGGLDDTMLQIDNGNFKLTVDATLDADSVQGDLVDWGLDIFTESSGSKEGMCIGIASAKYIADSRAGSNFYFQCDDNGDGTFNKRSTPKVDAVSDVRTVWPKGSPCVTPTPTPTPTPPTPKQCDLNWFYCPNDPGCSDYQLSIKSVEVDVHDKKGISAGDTVTMIVTGRTNLTAVPPHASYKVYSMPGKNIAQGGLDDTMLKINNGNFRLTVDATLDADSVTGGLVDWGLDIFTERSGSKEGMCIGIANAKYIADSRAGSNFYFQCDDNGDGTFNKRSTPKVDAVSDVACKLV